MPQRPWQTGAVSFAVVVSTAYGQMIVNRNDINQANPLLKTGLAIDHEEIQLLASLLAQCPADPVVVDVGANFGTYSLALAAVAGPGGMVHAFEPQRIIFNMLAGSVALNSLTHVRCYHSAVGDREDRIEIPQFNYAAPMNFGSVEFGPEQRETLSQVRFHDAERIEYVPLTTLDRFGWKRVDLMKIDVEGMEMDVLRGACQTIARCRPVLFVEFAKSDATALAETITRSDYAVLQTGINFLAVPIEASGLLSLAQVACSPEQARASAGIKLHAHRWRV